MLGIITETNNKLAYSIQESSSLTSLSKSLLRNAIRDGELKIVRPGKSRRVLILKDDLINYLKGENDEKK